MYVHHVKVGSHDYKRFYNHKASERWVKMMETREENERRTPGLRKDYENFVKGHGCRFFVIGSCKKGRQCDYAHTATLKYYERTGELYLRWMRRDGPDYHEGAPFYPKIADISKTWRERSLQSQAHAMYLTEQFPTLMADFDVTNFQEQVSTPKESPRHSPAERSYPPAEGSSAGVRLLTKEQLIVRPERMVEAQLAHVGQEIRKVKLELKAAELDKTIEKLTEE